MQKVDFSDIVEGGTYLIYNRQFDCLNKKVCVYDHTKRLMGRIKNHRPLKYFVDITNGGRVIPTLAQVEKIMTGGEEIDQRSIQAIWDFEAASNMSVFTEK